MICFPNAKINLGLSILSKRPDGFHNLETIFYPLPFTDVLEIVEAESTTSMHLTGLPVPGNPEDNLVLRAWALLKDKTGLKGQPDIHLHKVIPMGSGLGGGSSDAAFFLGACNEFYGLDLSGAELEEMALQLGSDCPFFLHNRACYATGRGEILEERTWTYLLFPLALSIPELTSGQPGHFPGYNRHRGNRICGTLCDTRYMNGKTMLHNDFETSVMEVHPEMKKIKEDLYAAGAVYASMTGSGSAFYGIFPKGLNPAYRMPDGTGFHFIP